MKSVYRLKSERSFFQPENYDSFFVFPFPRNDLPVIVQLSISKNILPQKEHLPRITFLLAR